jgi:hypothetical protein
MRVLTLTLAAALLAACFKKNEAPPPPKTVEAPMPMRPTANKSFDCNSILPKEARDKYLDGMQMALERENNGVAGRILDCPMRKDENEAHIQVICTRLMTYSVNTILDNAKSQMNDVKDVAGVGRRAFAGMHAGKRVLHFADDDTSCYGSLVSVPHAEEVAKVIASNLTPALMMQ